MGSNFLIYTVFTSLAIYLLILVAAFKFIDIHFLMLALVNVYFVYTFLLELFSFLVFLKFYYQDSNY